MKPNVTHSHSFVVRIWREGDDAGHWRGWVQHAGTGEAAYVNNLNELLTFVERRAGPLAGTPADAGAPGAGLK